MKTVIKLLKSELREWKKELNVLNFLHQAYLNPLNKKRMKVKIKKQELNIAELEAAIKKLKG